VCVKFCSYPATAKFWFREELWGKYKEKKSFPPKEKVENKGSFSKMTNEHKESVWPSQVWVCGSDGEQSALGRTPATENKLPATD
jgi:hypothetical protein